MLGSVSEAEDIVQEALLRLHVVLQQGERIESPRAYLSTVDTRMSKISSARLASHASDTSASGCPSRWSMTVAAIRRTAANWRNRAPSCSAGEPLPTQRPPSAPDTCGLR